MTQGRRTLVAVVVLASAIAALAVLAVLSRYGPAPATRSPPATMEDDHHSVPVSELSVGSRLERTIATGTTHRFELSLETADYASVVAEQAGADVRLRLLAPDGRVLTEIDSPIGRYGAEKIAVVAAEPGRHLLEVERLDGERREGAGGAAEADPGRYALSVAALRVATPEDRLQVAAEHAFAEGEAARRQGEHEAALEPYRRALGGFRELGDLAGEADALYRIGWMHHELERRDAALEHYRAALPLYAQLGDLAREAAAANRVGRLVLLGGDPDGASELHRRAAELFARLGDAAGEAAATSNLGNALDWSGETEAALAAYERAIELWRGEERLGEEASTWLSLGTLYLAQDRLDVAIARIERALEMARRAGDDRTTGVSLWRLGEALYRQGDLVAARERLEQALEVWRERGSRRGRALTLSSLGTVALAAGETAAAREHLDEALELFRAIGDRQGEATARHKLGRVAHASGALALALRHHRAALAGYRATGDRAGAAAARYGAARALYQTGDPAAARGVLEDALDATEQLRSAAVGDASRTAYFASRRHYWDLYVAILMRLHEAQPEAGLDLRALEATERWRARGLLDLLAESGVDPRAGASAALLERERRLQQAVEGAERQRLGLLESQRVDPETLEALERRVGELLVALESARGEIRRTSPRFAALDAPSPLSLAEVQRLLDDRTLLVAYHLGEERSFAWTVSTRGVVVYPLAGRSEIDGAVRELHGLLPRLALRADAARERAAGRVGELLLEPLAERLADRQVERLAVVPDGALHYLPFAALPLPGSPSDLLLDRFEVAHLPSASVLGALRDLTTRRTAASGRLAVVADPVFGLDDERLGETRPAARPPDARAAASSEPRRLVTRAARDLGLERLERLRHTRREAAAILRLVKPERRLAALGFDADRSLFADGRLAHYRIVHLATHGFVHPRHPELSGLVLSLLDRDGRPRDGFLRLHELYRLDLPASLAVLSACRTGLGAEVEGEGLVGITRGFMHAGVPRVVHSLWEVDDESTAVLMEHFYRGLLTDRLPPAEALRRAQQALRDDPRWREPYYWAAFVFQGDWHRGTGEGDDDFEESDTGGTGQGARGDDDLPPPGDQPPE